MNHTDIEKLGFVGRLESLRKIKRWKSFQPAFYRHDLEMHTLEILFILEDLEPIIKDIFPKADLNKARLLALIHDDAETVSKDGDVEYNKKLNMTQKEIKDLEEEEKQAIEVLTTMWPKQIFGYNYHDLLIEAKEKNTQETQLISFIDKFSALCESLHELYAGNQGFHKGWQTERARPPVKGSNIVDLIPKYNLISPLFSLNHPIIPPYKKPDVKDILYNSKPHTKESIMNITQLPHYNYWKETIIKRGKEKGIKWLTEKKEF